MELNQTQMAKLKKGSSAWWRKKAVELAKKIAKERDGYVCQRCNKEVKGANAHGSHVFTAKAYPSISADPLNIKCLCYYCHFNWWHKEIMEAKDWFIKKFPERYEYLLEAKNNSGLDYETVFNDLKKMIK